MKPELRHLLAGVAFVLFAGPATAQSFGSGRLEFGYREFPTGPYSGRFYAEGSVLDFGAFPPSAPGAVHAAHVQHNGLHIIIILGGFQNADGSGDVAFLYLQSDEPFTPGTYVVDPVTYSVVFGFVDDATGIQIPDQLWDANWETIFDSVLAAHKMGSVSGLITLDEVTPGRVSGSFAGYLAEPDGIRAVVTDASFTAGAVVLPVETSSWGSVKAAYRD
jgi:hypothetical protein